jgi:GABA(A) receptor-associated protein
MNTFNYRYLVPHDLTAYHFNYIIRKRIKLPEKDSLYFFVGGKYMLKGGNIWLGYCLTNSIIDTLMMSVYDARKDPDGFLYIVYTEESTLGGE